MSIVESSTPYPRVPLGEIARPISRSIPIEPGKAYRTLGVKWWGEGAYERQTIDGAETTAKTLSLVREGDLIINKIWVRHGSTAIARADVDGCAASGEFPTFELDRARVLPAWLHWQTKTPGFWAKCDALSQGTSGKNRIKPDLFLTIEVPLPPLAEQRRVVARVEGVAAKLAEARRLRAEAVGEAEALMQRIITAIFENCSWPIMSLGDVLRENSLNGLAARPSDAPPGLPILRISAATSRADAFINETDYKYLEITDEDLTKYQLEQGDLLACRFNGNLHFVERFALYRGEYKLKQVYPDKLIRFRVETATLLPEFARIVLNSKKVRNSIEGFCATTAGNIGISAGNLKTVALPIPPLPEQRRIVAELDALNAKVDALRALQAETAAELDALLPAVLDRAFRGEL